MKCPVAQSLLLKRRSKSNLEKYGVENVYQSEIFKNKIKQTNLEKYGFESASSTPEFKEKVRNTSLRKYGTTSTLQSKEVREKAKVTSLKKFGNENPSSSQIIKDKVKQTNLKRHGVEYNLQIPEVREKLKECNLKNFGVEHIAQSEEFKTRHKIKRIKTYKKEILPIRLQQLANSKIEPFMWGIEDYIGQHVEYKFIHKVCNKTFSAYFRNGSAPVCPYCKCGRSAIEQKLFNILEQSFPNIEMNNRKLISPYEIDMVINDIGIEVNGVYWHQSRYSNGRGLLFKTEKSPIQLLHFWDYELLNKFEICLSMIYTKLNKFENTIFASSCDLRPISKQESELFFNENHLLGYRQANYCLGLIYKNKIVQAISIGENRTGINADFEIYRIATKLNTTVIDGIQNLFAKVKNDFVGSTLIGYADKRYSQGKVYRLLGFAELKDTPPAQSWIKNGRLQSNFQCQKPQLKKLLGVKYDNSKSEIENMEINTFLKVEDCGNKVFTINFRQ